MSHNNINFKSVFPGKYIQGENILNQLPDYIKNFGEKGLILSSKTVKRNYLLNLIEEFESLGIIIEDFNGECSQKEINRIIDIINLNGIDVIVAIGGGKVIDTVKIAADRANIPVIIVPTIASTDAPCSGCAVVYSENGVFERVDYQKMNPQVILVDAQIIANAPSRFLVSGIGDALATWFEAESCNRTKSLNECGGLSTITGLNLARLCYDTILEFGLPAKVACENKIVSPALHRVIEANILLSGIGFESSGLAAAHSIHNGLSILPQTHSFYHGEKVAFGLLASLHLTGVSTDEIEKVYQFCERIGLPTTLGDIGLGETDKKELLKAAIKTCDPKESIHHEAGEMNPERVLNSLIAADAWGKQRNERKK